MTVRITRHRPLHHFLEFFPFVFQSSIKVWPRPVSVARWPSSRTRVAMAYRPAFVFHRAGSEFWWPCSPHCSSFRPRSPFSSYGDTLLGPSPKPSETNWSVVLTFQFKEKTLDHQKKFLGENVMNVFLKTRIRISRFEFFKNQMENSNAFIYIIIIKKTLLKKDCARCDGPENLPSCT